MGSEAIDMNPRTRRYVGFRPDDIYIGIELIRRLREIGYTNRARLEFSEGVFVKDSRPSDFLSLEERLPSNHPFSFNLTVSQKGKAPLLFSYSIEAEGYLYLRNGLIS